MSMKIFLSIMVVFCIGMITFSPDHAYSQTTAVKPDTITPLSYPTSMNHEKGTRIKWTWQLPHGTRKAFNQTALSAWYIEKMISYDDGDKTVYKFFLSNGCLVDGDHYDSFLQKAILTIVNNEVLVSTKSSE
jgi:hypothetical protein